MKLFKLISTLMCLGFFAASSISASAAVVEVQVRVDTQGLNASGLRVDIWGGQVQLTKPLDKAGVAIFQVPVGDYKFAIVGLPESAFPNVRYTDDIKAPSSTLIVAPTPRLVKVRYLLPNGQSLPNIWPFYGGDASATRYSISGKWVAPISSYRSSDNEFTNYISYLPSGTRGQMKASNDVDGDGFTDPYWKVSSAYGGFVNLVTPSSTLLAGGDVPIQDAAFAEVNQKIITGVKGSTITLTGRFVTFGNAQIPKTAHMFQMAANARPENIPSIGSIGDEDGGIFKVSANGVFKFSTQIDLVGKIVIIGEDGSNYSFPSSFITLTSTKVKSKYQSCAALNADFQGGVMRKISSVILKKQNLVPTYNPVMYSRVSNLDRDKDGIACEK